MKGICAVPNCGGKKVVRGLCRTHYSRWKTHGETFPDRPIGGYAPAEKCTVENCNRPVQSRNLCNTHYTRFLKTGSTQPDRPITKNQHGKNNPRWKGGEVNDGHGRVLIYQPDHPNPSYNGTHVYRYRLVMEKHLGRHLLPSEIVHHKNGIHNDDRLDNLEVMTQAEHARLHATGRSFKNGKWSMSGLDCCRECGTKDKPHDAIGLCKTCYLRLFKRKRRQKNAKKSHI